MNLIGQFLSRLRRRPVDELKNALRKQTGDTSLLFLTDSMSAFSRGDLKSAMKHVTAGLRENPNHPRLLLFRGMIFFKDCRYKEAAEAFRQTLQVDPECKDALDMLQTRELSACNRMEIS
jgi:Tetratricopeptide repeat.